MLTRSAASTTYIRSRVKATVAGARVVPTGLTGQMAFMAAGDTPEAGDWKTASWDTDTTTSPTTYRLQCLIGPSGVVTLTAGLWTVWARVQDSPEDVQEPCGLLRII